MPAKKTLKSSKKTATRKPAAKRGPARDCAAPAEPAAPCCEARAGVVELSILGGCQRAALAVLLAKAASKIKADCDGLEPGSYTADVMLRIRGDVIVAEPAERESVTVGVGEVLAVMLSRSTDAEHDVSFALGEVRRLRRSAKGAQELSAAVKRAGDIVKQVAVARKFVESKPVAGATRCDPSVEVVGAA